MNDDHLYLVFRVGGCSHASMHPVSKPMGKMNLKSVFMLNSGNTVMLLVQFTHSCMSKHVFIKLFGMDACLDA
jgi:hypothetical protein